MTATPKLPKINDPLPVPVEDPALLETLLQRRSTKIAQFIAPGPDQDTLGAMISIASRVPDHGKLAPWRFIMIDDHGAAALGAIAASEQRRRQPDADSSVIDLEEVRFLRAPSRLVVVSSPITPHKIPVWEQQLSAGALCFQLLLAARAFGFAGAWLTEWVSYGPDNPVLDALGVAPEEQVAGIMYFGTPAAPPTERQRPDLHGKVSYFSG